jgi:hypothetical protein
MYLKRFAFYIHHLHLMPQSIATLLSFYLIHSCICQKLNFLLEFTRSKSPVVDRAESAFDRHMEYKRLCSTICSVAIIMDFLLRATSTIGGLPDPLIYSIIAVVASGAVYSTIHHVENWRPRHTKRVKLKGVEGRKVEDCTSSNYGLKSPTDSNSVDIMESWDPCSKHKL